MPPKIEIKFCTSCGSKDIEVTGQKYYCPDCDVTYKVTEAGTKVVETNPLGKQEARLSQAEKDIAELKGQKPAEPAPDDTVASEDDHDGENEDEEQDGFITFE